MTHLQKARELQAKSLLAAIEKRNMTAYYCESKEDCLKKVFELVPEKSTIAWGGSESIKEAGIPNALKESENYTVFDRAEYTSPEKAKEFNTLAFNSDYYFMSTNAITLDGVMLNIDGNGNRVANLIFGPEHVIVVVGMNKVVKDIDEAYNRVRNIASPPNTVRLGKNTPCSKLGRCGDCYGEDCICNQIVITRRSRVKERIIVLLVNDNLGF